MTRTSRNTPLHPKDILPNCPRCGKPIEYIRRKGLSTLKVEPKKAYFIPREDGRDTVITLKGHRRKGELVRDGQPCRLEHICR